MKRVQKGVIVPIGILAVAGMLGCGDGGGGGSTSPTPVLTSVSLAPATDMIRIKASESFTIMARFSDGSSQAVQGTWTTSAAGVATVDAGRVTGVSAGSTTITGEYQGMRGTQTVRVVPDYHGRWEGDWSVTGCSANGVFEGICEGEFDIGDLYLFVLNATQTRDTIAGTTDFGDTLGPVTGAIATDGHLSVSGTYVVTVEGLTIEVAVANWDTNSTDNQLMTGRFRLGLRVVGAQGTAQLDGDLHVVPKVSSAPSSVGADHRAGSLLQRFLMARRP